MTNLKQLKQNEQDIYPVTHEDAVLDNNGLSIGAKIKELGSQLTTKTK